MTENPKRKNAGMTDVIQPVALTSSNSEHLSRHEMLEWVNSTVNGQYKKIEELCSGVAYCQMMEVLYPHCVGLKRVKMNAKLEHEYLHNLKLFQAAFTKLQYEKTVPIERLIKGRFQDNFEFLQWFKKFFDTNSVGKENLKVPAALAAAAANAPKPIKRPAPIATKNRIITPPKTHRKSTYTPSPEKDNEQDSEDHSEGPVSPTSVRVLRDELDTVLAQVISVEKERDLHYKRLTTIEKLLHEAIDKNIKTEFSKQALNILYSTEENSSAPDSEEF